MAIPLAIGGSATVPVGLAPPPGSVIMPRPMPAPAMPAWAQPMPAPLPSPQMPLRENIPPPDVIQKHKDTSTKTLEKELKDGAENLGTTHKEKTDYLHAVANQQKQQFNVMLDQQVKEQEMKLLQEYNQQLKRLQQAAQTRKAELETQANNMAMEWQQKKVMEEFVRHKTGIEEQYAEAQAEIASKIEAMGVSASEVEKVAAKGAVASSFNAGSPPASFNSGHPPSNAPAPMLVPRPGMIPVIRQPTPYVPPGGVLPPGGIIRQPTSISVSPANIIRQPTAMAIRPQSPVGVRPRSPGPAAVRPLSPGHLVTAPTAPAPLGPPMTLGLAIDKAFSKVGQDIDSAFSKVVPESRLVQALGKTASFPAPPVAVYNTPLGMKVENGTATFSAALPMSSSFPAAPSARLPYMPPTVTTGVGGSYVSRGSITPLGSYQPPVCGSLAPTPVGSYIPAIGQPVASYMPLSPRLSVAPSPMGSYVPHAPILQSQSYTPMIRPSGVPGSYPASPMLSSRTSLRK